MTSENLFERLLVPEEDEQRQVFEKITRVARGNTDFEIGFDNLFGFMTEKPDSQTTKNFIDYHIAEQNFPSDFTYLIGKEFVAEDWISIEDMPAFKAYVEKVRS